MKTINNTGYSRKKLVDVAEIIMGQSPPGDTYHNFPKGMPFFQGKADFGEIHPITRMYCSAPTRIAEPNDILISVRAPVGPTNIAQVPCCIGRGLAAIRPQPKLEVFYLLYFLRFYETKLANSGRGSTFDAIGRDDLENIIIPLPPLDEQRRIAAILQRADRLRRLRRLSRQLSDTFLQSVFLQMFGDPATNPMGWEMRPAGDIFEIQLGKMRSEREITGDYLHPYLRNVNVQWGYLDLSDVKEMDFSPKEMSKYLLRKGDILVCEGGEVGRTAVYNGEIENCAYQNALHRLRAKNTSIINTNYFINFMRVACDSGLIAKFSSQVTIAHFTAEKFIDLGVMVPPISTQKEYSQICDRHRIMNIQQIESSRQSEQLFQTLLARAFSEI